MTSWPSASLSAFETEGYVRVPQLVAAEELELLRRIADNTLHRQLEAWSGSQRHAPGTPALYWLELNEWFTYYLRRSRLLESTRAFAEAAFGADSDRWFFGLRLFIKPAFVGAETPIHQDEPHRVAAVPGRTFNAWLGLDPAELESGALQYVPRTHQSGLLRHRPVDGPGREVGERFVGELPADPITLSCKPGDVVFHHGRVLHGAHPNRSPRARRAVVVAAWEPRPTELTK